MTQKRILLIDDDQIVLQSLKEVLEQANYRVMTASDGHRGLELALAESPDLVVLDLLLPGLDGFEICARLKEDADYAHIPIVMLTGVFITSEDMEKGLQLGAERFRIKADAYAAKPPVYEDLLRDIRVLLGDKESGPSLSENLVLVVDDDGLNREVLKQQLSSAGYPVVTAADGEEGWARFQSSAPSLVLLDIQMPGLDGLEVLRRIREQNTDVALIMMTAYGSEKIAVQAMKRGADDYLIKPFQPWQVVPLVKENLEKTHLRRLSKQLLAHLRESNARLLEKYRALEAKNVDVQEAYRRLQEAGDMQRQMTSMIVHDLKNPLNVMLISIDLLASDFGDMLTDSQQGILRSANLASQQMLHLITNLLKVQRLEDGKMPVNLENLDLLQVLKLTLRQAQPLADQSDVALSFSVDDDLPFVRADVDLTSRVVANLLDNALKFTPIDGQVVVSAQVRGDEAIVSVADSGPGVPADQSERIFEKFAQIDQGPRRGIASVGLGLAFCKLAVEAQGGRIWVESDPGEGSRFKFALPLVPS